jgi:hypothetical protein
VAAVINALGTRSGALHVHPHDPMQDCSHNHRNTQNEQEKERPAQRILCSCYRSDDLSPICVKPSGANLNKLGGDHCEWRYSMIHQITQSDGSAEINPPTESGRQSAIPLPDLQERLTSNTSTALIADSATAVRTGRNCATWHYVDAPLAHG